VTIDLGSTATKSISPSLSGDDLNGGGGACRTHITKNRRKKSQISDKEFREETMRGARCKNKIPPSDLSGTSLLCGSPPQRSLNSCIEPEPLSEK
jgi:hypothetical protein